MTTSRISLTRRMLSCVLAMLALGSGTAHALLFRAYLDPSGNDGNACTLAAPCRLLPAALAAVADGGEIWMLDSGNYNTAPVNIAKSVTILAIPGALGSVVAISGNAIDIATPGIRVTLRNLVIVPFPNGTGVHGISISAASALNVEGCVIAGITSSGIVATGGSVRVRDSTIRNSSIYGLWLVNGATATVSHSNIVANGDAGVSLLGSAASTTTVDIRDSTVGGGANGVKAVSTGVGNNVKATIAGSRIVGSSSAPASTANGVLASGAGATASVTDSIVAGNGVGISATGGAKAWSTGNTISSNTTGLSNATSTVNTSGNNAVRNNVFDVSGATTPAPMQ